MSDQKQEIAEILKTQRENLGLSIDDIYEHTRINPEFIKVLEAGQFEFLPVAYARLFLKTYARELELDVRDILSRFDRSVAPQPSRVTARSSSERGIGKIFVSLLAFAVIAVVIIFLNSREETPLTSPLDTTTSPLPVPDSTESVSPSEQISISEEEMSPDSAKSGQEMQLRDSTESVMPSQPLSENQVVPSDIVAETPASQPAPGVLSTYNLPVPGVIAEGEIMTLSNIAKETAHLSITADDREVFAGVLPMGQQQRWLAHNHFQVEIQRASAISLSLQNQPLEFASPPERGLRLTISRTLIKVEELEEMPSGPQIGQ